MLLSARFLNDVVSVNSMEIANSLEMYAGDDQTFYFQIVDLSLDRAEQGFSPAGRRYMPPAGSTLVVTLMNVDDAKVVRRYASIPFAQDPSIWSIPLLASDPLRGTVNLRMELSQPAPGPSTRILSFTSVPGVMLRVR
jgi:hypothetical protein